MKEKRSTTAPVAVAVLLLLLLPVLYVGSYFAVSKTRRSQLDETYRVFPSNTVADLYWPLLWIESAVGGRPALGQPGEQGWPGDGLGSIAER
jgi:hypothetical protein